jgi:hypothetical protein
VYNFTVVPFVMNENEKNSIKFKKYEQQTAKLDNSFFFTKMWPFLRKTDRQLKYKLISRKKYYSECVCYTERP